MLCRKCYGTGRIMGMGMMYEDCDCDNGNLWEENSEKPKNPPSKPQIDKRSKSYREAIKSLMENNNLNRDEAVSLFEEEYNRI